MSNKLENGRALFAYEKVSLAADHENKNYAKEYRALVRALPAMIHTNGFGAAVGFLFSKSNKKDGKGADSPHQAVLTVLSEWLKRQGMIEDPDFLMKAITEQTRDGYKRMTRETMSLVMWMKRFAEGMIESEAESVEKS
ncbi:type III-B CRISPR module-associated protein Cmr5 [Paenibacillus dendritiformis]|uniref:type III-B CRISPR module-associated protein Cmr5 n=1 Tax=Paenibacillus dendritiformis TaxID=130049 RepID=UPI000DA7F35C|nr:type III-B CRISPR module-associated protein Cmr5 [Paenibacillus dendritiformis]PZM66780.1 type III-B CRISPR module-associated protein Cmr5 [Paenibacillus dendritiformis]